MSLHKRLLAALTVIAILFISSACGKNEKKDPENADSERFRTVGLYVWDDVPNQHQYWKACGIDTLVFCDRGWWYSVEALDSYLSNITMWIDSAHNSGFKAYILLFSNIEQYQGPEKNEPSGLGIKFHPSDDQKLNDRVSYLKKTITAAKEADGFTLLAGDPGGITNDMGRGGAQDFIKLASAVKSMIRETAPDAQFNINTWAISYYYTPNQGTGSSKFWTNETEMTKEVIAADGLIDAETGIEFPTHDYYRPLTLRAYFQMMKNDDSITEYPLYPLKHDIEELKARSVKNIWAWPYFLMDEADDGDPGGGSKTALPQIETRYIQSYLEKMEAIGINGVIGNWSHSGYKNKSLNTFVFGRLAGRGGADLTLDNIYKEYAGFIADDETVPVLVEVLKFVENDSNWQKKLPSGKRLENFSVEIETPQQALEKLSQVKLNTKPAVIIPDGASKFLDNLKKRIEWMME